jgi:hypothetical protein
VSSKYYLPPKIGNYLKRLELEYSRTDRTHLLEIITEARFEVVEETSYDNWNGGTYAHDVILYLPPSIIGELSPDWQKQLGDEVCVDLNKCTGSVSNEGIRLVHLELADEGDPRYQRSVNASKQPETNPDTLSFWKAGHLRLFISHRDQHKVMARRLGDALSEYGISPFVAHDTIVPMKTWQSEIEKGLETMEVMLAFLTDDFHESTWTNQEIGYALGRSVPIISVKFGAKSPAGFIGSKQALRGHLDRPEGSAPAIYKLLVEEVGERRLRENLITAFCDSGDFDETRKMFDRLTNTISTLSGDEIKQIQTAFASNHYLNNAYYLSYHGRLTGFMKRCTGQDFEIATKQLVTKKEQSKQLPDDKTPF